MMGKTSRYKRIPILISMVMLLLAAGVSFAFAAQSASMPQPREESGTLTIETKYVDEDQTTPISGMEITIYKVADLRVENGNVKYVLTSNFKDADVDFRNMTVSESITAAKRLYSIAREEGISGTSVMSENGYARFGKVSHGMYLAVQTGARDEALGYTAIEPYLIMAPQPLTDIGKDEWDYEVTSIPKTEVGPYEEITFTVRGSTEPDETTTTTGEEETITVRGSTEPDETTTTTVPGETTGKNPPGRSTSTGDTSPITICILALIFSACAIIIIVVGRRRKRQGSSE